MWYNIIKFRKKIWALIIYSLNKYVLYCQDFSFVLLWQAILHIYFYFHFLKKKKSPSLPIYSKPHFGIFLLDQWTSCYQHTSFKKLFYYQIHFYIIKEKISFFGMLNFYICIMLIMISKSSVLWSGYVIYVDKTILHHYCLI